MAELHTTAVDEYEVRIRRMFCAARRTVPLEELKNGLGTSDFYLTSRLGVVRSIPKQL